MWLQGALPQSSHKANEQKPMNVLMMVDVASVLVDPWRHSLLRGSGTVGAYVFERVVEGGHVPCSIRPFNPHAKETAGMAADGTHIKSFPTICLEGDDEDNVARKHASNSTLALAVPLKYANVIRIDIFGYSAGANMVGNATLVAKELTINVSLHRALYPDTELTGYGVSLAVIADTLIVYGDSDGAMLLPSDVMPRTVRFMGTWPKVVDDFMSHSAAVRNILQAIQLPEFGQSTKTATTTTASQVSSTPHAFKGFMKGCRNVRDVDLRPLRFVTLIGPGFLEDCASLRTLDLSPLGGVTSCGARFLAGCSGLGSVDLSPLRSVTKVGPNPLMCCTSLVSVDVSMLPFSNSMSGLLQGCTALKDVALPHFTGVHSGIPDDLLANCTSLIALRFHAPSTEEYATAIGSGFLTGCSSLEYLDLSCLRNVRSVGRDFLFECTSLKIIDIAPIANALASVPIRFLARCRSLITVDLSPLHGLTKVVGMDFMRECSSLVEVDLGPLAGTVREVYPGFLSECSSLVDLDFDPVRAAIVR